MLALENAEVFYGKAKALHAVSIELRLGEVVSLIGRNGAGKSTMLKALIGLLPLASGRRVLEGADVSARKPHRITQPLRHRQHPLAHRPSAGARGPSGAPPSAPCDGCCTRGRRHGPCRNRPQNSRAHSRHSGRARRRGQRCRIPGICERLGAQRRAVCSGRPGRRTGLRWPRHAKSRSARLLCGTAAFARDEKVESLYLYLFMLRDLRRNPGADT